MLVRTKITFEKNIKKVLTKVKDGGIIIYVVEKQVGVNDAEGPPVPIPNTEVKLSGAENTWLATARENREMPTHKSVHPVGWAFFILRSHSRG